MNILAVGDVFGVPGVDILTRRLGRLRAESEADIVVVNGENACIRGISPAFADAMFQAGADVITLGNHALDNRQICDYFDDNKYIIRPANMPGQYPGPGYALLDCMGKRVCVMNLIGRKDMDFGFESPFSVADSIMKEAGADIYVVDFHAEATSEKAAMAYFLDGRASVLFGTHTHVPTADERVFPGGLGFITDVGMTGAMDSVIGVKPRQSLSAFLGELPSRFEAADGDVRIQSALFTLNAQGACLSVRRIELY